MRTSKLLHYLFILPSVNESLLRQRRFTFFFLFIQRDYRETDEREQLRVHSTAKIPIRDWISIQGTESHMKRHVLPDWT